MNTNEIHGEPESTAGVAPQPAEIPELDKLVSGPRLLELLWEDESRPSLRWLRTQTKRRTIPFARSAGRVWFVPRQVRAAMMRIETRRGRPRKTVIGPNP
jgi:hypothetical protein